MLPYHRKFPPVLLLNTTQAFNVLEGGDPFKIDQNSFKLATVAVIALPNQELSGAKSELPGETVGVCSFRRRCGQLLYNLPITHFRFTPRSLQVCLLAHFNK